MSVVQKELGKNKDLRVPYVQHVPCKNCLGNPCSILLSYRDQSPRTRCLYGTWSKPHRPNALFRIAFFDQEHRIRKPVLYPAELPRLEMLSSISGDWIERAVMIVLDFGYADFYGGGNRHNWESSTC